MALIHQGVKTSCVASWTEPEPEPAQTEPSPHHGPWSVDVS